MPDIPAPSVQDRIVAFVDILGFADLVRTAFEGDDRLLYRLHRILRSTATHAAVAGEGPFGIKEFSPYLQATAFSDSIVISDVYEGGALERVTGTASLLSSLLLLEGILCRGGIARGRTIHDERVLLGTGPLNAYELERQVAVFPRLVLADDLVSEAAQLSFQRIKTDLDGFRFIDVFHQFSGVHQAAADILFGKSLGHGVSPEDAFARIRSVVMRGLEREKRPSVVGKYRWLARQFNEATADYLPGRIEGIAL